MSRTVESSQTVQVTRGVTRAEVQVLADQYSGDNYYSRLQHRTD